MDPEHLRRDARAVEDPIAATFELAESVDRQTPKIRKMLRYVRWFVALWLLVDFFLILIVARERVFLGLILFGPLVGCLLAARYVESKNGHLALMVLAAIFAILQVLVTGDLLIGTLLVFLFILGFVILDLLRDLRSFFDYFALRHRVILAVRAADPVVHVPQGKDAAARILAHLSATHPDLRAVMTLPGALATPALLTGRSGLTYSFDAYIRSEPSTLSRILHVGPAGFAVFVKAFDRAPTLADLQSLKTAVEDVCVATRIPPARIVAVWKAHGDESVAADTYEFLTHQAARVTIRGSTYACSLELAREGDDGTYDFIPFVVQPVTAGARTAAS
ncbi:MAG TPA: hypothetical protein HA326_09150 [Thermoplasmata archaeon]|nr:hypothetical protein [Thermoplasmata archaeon]